jgi:CRP-like cAMP-binding protein
MTGTRIDKWLWREGISLLKRVSLFADITKQQLLEGGEPKLVHLPEDAVLVAQGDQNCAFWIFLEGEVRVIRMESDGGTNLLFN